MLSKRDWLRTLADRTAESLDYCVLDCEMTGLDQRKHEIISIGAVKIRHGRILLEESFHRLVRPAEWEMTKNNVLIHRISHDQVGNGEEPDRVISDFLDFISDSVLIGHFAFIDINFLNRLMKKLSQGKIRNPVLDTVAIFKWRLMHDKSWQLLNADNHQAIRNVSLRLPEICDRLDVPRFREHHAYYDALTTACLFLKLLKMVEAAGIYAFRDIYKIAGL